MKTQHSQKLQINKYHLKDNNNKINHHSRERDLFLSPLEMFAFCVTEKASGSCPGVSFSWFWTQSCMSVSSLAYVLLACFLSLLGVAQHPMKPARWSCVCWGTGPTGAGLWGPVFVQGQNWNPSGSAVALLCVPKQVRALSGLFSSLFSSTLNSQATGNREKGREPQKMTSGKVIFLHYIYICVCVCVYVYMCVCVCV